MSVVFDKLSFTRKLEGEGGFQRSQAERLADAFHDAVGETVATKDDVARLDAKIDGRMQALEATIRAEIAQSKVWTVGVAVALFSALTAIRFFGH